MVRLEVQMVLFEEEKELYFNSKMVRLEDTYFLMNENPEFYFNSKMVRLEVGKVGH